MSFSFLFFPSTPISTLWEFILWLTPQPTGLAAGSCLSSLLLAMFDLLQVLFAEPWCEFWPWSREDTTVEGSLSSSAVHGASRQPWSYSFQHSSPSAEPSGEISPAPFGASESFPFFPGGLRKLLLFGCLFFYFSALSGTFISRPFRAVEVFPPFQVIALFLRLLP